VTTTTKHRDTRIAYGNADFFVHDPDIDGRSYDCEYVDDCICEECDPDCEFDPDWYDDDEPLDP
jgi:hypothetical protein